MVPGIGGNPGRIAIATQIHQDHGEHLGQFVSHCVPHGMRLRMSVQQQQRRTASAAQSVQDSGRTFYGAGNKIFEHQISLVGSCPLIRQLAEILSQ